MPCHSGQSVAEGGNIMANFIPRGWTRNTNEQLWEIYKEACNEAIKLGLIDYIPELYIFKSTRTWGWARYPSKTQERYGYKPYVGLNEVYLQDPTKAISTICHELAHIVSPRREHHGDVWKHNFVKIGTRFGLSRFERCSSSESIGLEMPKQYKYEAYCPRCGMSWKRQKMVRLIQEPDKYCCPICTVKLKSRKINEV